MSRLLKNKRFRFHGLKRPKIRQDMKKETLYNLSRLANPNFTGKTYFQQKWAAKAMTRAYHGEQLKERQWIHLFSKTAPSAVPMDPSYLARFDGSEQAAGRGSGLTPPPGKSVKTPRFTPYMQMTYHPTERRLDTAIFRALFASSTRQARQFVVHGQVKVNGKLMRHPGYLLNPGDLFTVNPERVLFALGKKKETSSTTKESEEDDISQEDKPSTIESAASTPQPAEDEIFDEAAEEEDEEEADEELSENDPLAGSKRTLRTLRTDLKTTLSAKKKDLSGARLRELRALSRDVRASMSRVASLTPSELEDLQTTVQSALTAATSTSPSSSSSQSSSSSSSEKSESDLTPSQKSSLEAALTEARENPYDPSKPYLTPWEPRDYMSPFAFIPRYLEVNQNICGAVYLRHPICYPGVAEVPTPFSYDVGQLAFSWYLRRR